LRPLSIIRFGTEGYPDRIARRLRALNVAAWIVAAVSAGFAVVQFLDPAPDVWKIALVNALAAPTFAAVPLLHRFGPIAAAAAILPVAYLDLFILLSFSGTDTGMQFYYLAGTGLTFLFFGIERIFLSALYAGLALALVIVVGIIVPHDTGVLTPAAMFGSFLASVTGAALLLITTVFFALREAAQAEQKLAREKEQVQAQSRQLETANKYKSHFLASASHDLRQPLHALNLFVAQLQGEADPTKRRRLVGRIEDAVGSVNELFGSLLDMTKLDAGMLQSNIAEFPLERLFAHIQTTFGDAAKAKGLRLRVVPTGAWTRSDVVLLERMLMNLVSNAVSYTQHGGIAVGCRRRGTSLRIDVCDTGPGIPENQQQRIFGEFYQFEAPKADRRGSLGLGLAIVERLGQLLGHAVELKSRLGHGSRFSITVPRAAGQREPEAAATPAIVDPAAGKLVVVIDDDPLVLEGMSGVLRSWGCSVVAGDSAEAVLAGMGAGRRMPDLIISDYRLAGGGTGIDAVRSMREKFKAEIPAFLISGDTAPERLRDASDHGLHLLHKPVPPMRLRAMLNQLLRQGEAAAAMPPAAE
jgi:signal transduction histidine kinase/CheY-like chemotaxis protein